MVTADKAVSRSPAAEPPPDPWMTAREAADALGMSRLALYERALNGEVVTQRIAGRRLFDRASVEAFRRRETAAG